MCALRHVGVETQIVFELPIFDRVFYSARGALAFHPRLRVCAMCKEDRHLDQQQAKKIVHRGVHEATNEKGHDHAHESRLYESLRIHALEADPVEVVDDFLRVHSNKLRNVRPGLLTLNPLILIKDTNE